MNRPKKLDLKNLISWGGSKNPAFFYFTAINEQIQNIAQKKDTLCRRMYN